MKWHAIIGFNRGLLSLVESPVLGPGFFPSKHLGRRGLVGDSSVTGCRLVANQLQWLQKTTPQYFLDANWLQNSRPVVVEQSPNSGRPFCIPSRKSRQPIASRWLLDPQLICNCSATTWSWFGIYCLGRQTYFNRSPNSQLRFCFHIVDIRPGLHHLKHVIL